MWLWLILDNNELDKVPSIRQWEMFLSIIMIWLIELNNGEAKISLDFSEFENASKTQVR